MKTRPAFPTRPIWIAIALFGATIVGMSGARSRHERVLYGAVQIGLALMCLGRALWLYADIVARRQWFVWPVYTVYRGRHVRGFVYGMRVGAIAFGLIGLWSFAIWLMALWPGHR